MTKHSLSAPRTVGGAGTSRSPWGLLITFFVMLSIPVSFELAGIRLSSDRILILTALLPSLSLWAAGYAGKRTAADILIICYAVWGFLSLMIHEGAAQIPFSFLISAEAISAYFLGRVLIKSYYDYRALFSVHIAFLLIMLPFAIPELLTGRPVLIDFFSVFGDSHEDVEHPPRMGLYRVQSVMQHPILFGLFCSMAVGNVFYLWKGQIFSRSWRLVVAVFMTLTSLSSAPLLSTMTQIGLGIWDYITKGKWWLLFGLFVSTYIFLSIASNRGPVVLLVDTLTFSKGNGWIRIHIWNYGIQNVINHPLLGIGFSNWERPHWLPPSIDNFWLVLMVRHGFPIIVFLGGAIIFHIIGCIRKKTNDPQVMNARTGHLITLVGICFTISTVHIWGPLHILFMFYLGAGGWIYTQDHSPNNDMASLHSEQNRTAHTYTRFKTVHSSRPVP